MQLLKKILNVRMLHLISFMAMMGIFFIAAIAYIRGNLAYVQLLGFEPIEIGKCFYREKFGITCPSCGLTRSFISLVDIRLSDAIYYNRVGPFVFLMLVFTAIWNLIGIFKPKHAAFWGKILAVYATLTCIGLVMSWVLKYFFAT